MNYKIDHKSKKPLHLQAEELLKGIIEKDEYKSGKLLPKEVDMAKAMNISRNTLRQAINRLVFEGYLIRKRGYGTIVAPKGIVGGVKNWLSFSQEMKMLGVEIKNFELSVRYSDVNRDVKTFFGIENDEKCLTLERVRGNKDFPFVYFISYFNPDIPLSSDENFTMPLYEILQNSYGIIVKTSKEEISARLAGNFIASKLNISEKDPILVRKRYVYDEMGKPIEYNIGYYKADSFTYTITSER